MKRFSSLRMGALAVLALAALSPLMKADEYDRKTIISLSQPLEVPGAVLQPGTYVMKLFTSSSNRHIVQFMNERQNKQLALTFAIAAERVRPAEKTLLTMYEGGQGSPQALRTWYYPGDTVGQEFLYPHKQAVSISERDHVKVPEIESTEKTSVTETAAAVTPAEPIQATAPETRDEPVLIARAEPAPEPAPVPEPQAPATPAAQSQAQADRTEPVAPAPADTTTSSDSLPQTAGYGPLAGLIGGVSFILAFGMRKLKRSRAL